MALRFPCRPTAAPSGRPLLAAGARWLCLALLTSVACTASLEPLPENPAQPQQPEPAELPIAPSFQEEQTIALQGDNLAATNLGGPNLAATNLAATNLGGPEPRRPEPGRPEPGVARTWADRTSGATTWARNNLAATNLGGDEPAGTNLASTNLAGTNLAATNLGSNLSGTNLAGTTWRATTWASTNLGGHQPGRHQHRPEHPQPGRRIHQRHALQRRGHVDAQDRPVRGAWASARPPSPSCWASRPPTPRSRSRWASCPGASPASRGGPITLQAWEAVVWGDKTYCVFVLAAPAGGDLAGRGRLHQGRLPLERPARADHGDQRHRGQRRRHDSTVSTAIHSYTGMMNAAARFRAGEHHRHGLRGRRAGLRQRHHQQPVGAGRLFLLGARTRTRTPLVLGNVTSVNPPTYAEALYIALDNGDGTVQILLDDAASRAKVMPAGMTNSVVDLNAAYLAWQDGLGPKPVPRRCGGALYLKTWFSEPVPARQVRRRPGLGPRLLREGRRPWSTVCRHHRSDERLHGAQQERRRATSAGRSPAASCGTMKTVLSETYVHMWEPNFDIPFNASCIPESNAAFCARRGKNCGAVTGTDNCGAARTVSNCGNCASPATCGGAGVANVCGSTNSVIYEAEALGNTLNGNDLRARLPRSLHQGAGQRRPGHRRRAPVPAAPGCATWAATVRTPSPSTTSAPPRPAPTP